MQVGPTSFREPEAQRAAVVCVYASGDWGAEMQWVIVETRAMQPETTHSPADAARPGAQQL